MTSAAKRLSEAAKALPAGDRLELAAALLASLDTPDDAIDELWIAEAEDRLAAYRRGETTAAPLSEILAKYAIS